MQDTENTASIVCRCSPCPALERWELQIFGQKESVGAVAIAVIVEEVAGPASCQDLPVYLGCAGHLEDPGGKLARQARSQEPGARS